MLKTNSRKARENVRAYIFNTCEDICELADEYGETLYSVEDITNLIKREFFRVQKHDIERIGYQEAFSEYAAGLPFNIFDYHYNISAVKIVGDILEETVEERSRFTEQQAEKLLDYLIFRECKII